MALGYYPPGDGGGGHFYFDRSPELQAEADGGIIIAPQLGPLHVQGSWIRLDDGPLNVRWFGAYGDGINDDTSAINNAIKAATTPVFGRDSQGGTTRVIRPAS